MGKFSEGWDKARVAQEERDAEKRRRAERQVTALQSVEKALTEDAEMLKSENIIVHIEHGALVLKRLAEPMAGVTYDVDKDAYHIHKYTSSDSAEALEADGVDDCVTKLGEFAFSMKH